MNRALDALARLVHTIAREQAVLMGLALAVLEAAQRGEITKATAVPVIAGIVLRFFVTPTTAATSSTSRGLAGWQADGPRPVAARHPAPTASPSTKPQDGRTVAALPQPQRRRLPPHRLSRRQRPPALGTVINGRPDLNGPLCNVLLARNGDCYIIAAGTANHAGTGGWRGLSGNSSVLGIEAENNGVGEPWPAHQIDAYVRLCAAMCDGGGFTPTPSVTTASGHPPASLTLPVPVSHRVTSGAGGSRKPSPKETP